MGKLWSFKTLPVAFTAATLVCATVDDSAKDAAPYHNEQAAYGIGFHSFRIPTTVTTSTGRILTFSEGRRHDNRDFDDINLVYKRTKTTIDHGIDPSDWEGLQEVVGKGNGTWGNPTAVVDGSTTYLFLSWNSGDYSQNGGDTLPSGIKTKKIDSTWEGRRHLYPTQSTDDGKTWAEHTDMTKQLTPKSWSWDAVGPGSGITMRSGEVVIPATGRNIVGRGVSGKRTWSYQSLRGAGAEGTITQNPGWQLPAVRSPLLVHLRWTTVSLTPRARGQRCCTTSADAKGPERTIFLNSADKDSRRTMMVRISYDADADMFYHGRELSDGSISGVGLEGGYSSMTKTADFKIGALVEADWYQIDGSNDDHRAIVWRRFNLSWMLNRPKS
ncbi:Exo-alpha-sialidase [Cladobotryum mycophilum]|uniref:Exo-alpha-sialidase n=1 Tax=Cladobotryum mycophilum TaxID=491253 RepID=A0ABR0SRB9_9HYPO